MRKIVILVKLKNQYFIFLIVAVTNRRHTQVEGGAIMDTIVRQGKVVPQLFADQDQPLPVWRNAFLVLELGLNVLNSVWWLNRNDDSRVIRGVHENLHMLLLKDKLAIKTKQFQFLAD